MNRIQVGDGEFARLLCSLGLTINSLGLPGCSCRFLAPQRLCWTIFGHLANKKRNVHGGRCMRYTSTRHAIGGRTLLR